MSNCSLNCLKMKILPFITSLTVITEMQVSAHSSSTLIALTVSNNPNVDQTKLYVTFVQKYAKKRPYNA
jgi:hypothetical protein